MVQIEEYHPGSRKARFRYTSSNNPDVGCHYYDKRTPGVFTSFVSVVSALDLLMAIRADRTKYVLTLSVNGNGRVFMSFNSTQRHWRTWQPSFSMRPLSIPRITITDLIIQPQAKNGWVYPANDTSEDLANITGLNDPNINWDPHHVIKHRRHLGVLYLKIKFFEWEESEDKLNWVLANDYRGAVVRAYCQAHNL